jgi:hypothetical protein
MLEGFHADTYIECITESCDTIRRIGLKEDVIAVVPEAKTRRIQSTWFAINGSAIPPCIDTHIAVNVDWNPFQSLAVITAKFENGNGQSVPTHGCERAFQPFETPYVVLAVYTLSEQLFIV